MLTVPVPLTVRVVRRPRGHVNSTLFLVIGFHLPSWRLTYGLQEQPDEQMPGARGKRGHWSTTDPYAVLSYAGHQDYSTTQRFQWRRSRRAEVVASGWRDQLRPSWTRWTKPAQWSATT